MRRLFNTKLGRSSSAQRSLAVNVKVNLDARKVKENHSRSDGESCPNSPKTVELELAALFRALPADVAATLKMIAVELIVSLVSLFLFPLGTISFSLAVLRAFFTLLALRLIKSRIVKSESMAPLLKLGIRVFLSAV